MFWVDAELGSDIYLDGKKMHFFDHTCVFSSLLSFILKRISFKETLASVSIRATSHVCYFLYEMYLNLTNIITDTKRPILWLRDS